jgi:hypothetical protein
MNVERLTHLAIRLTIQECTIVFICDIYVSYLSPAVLNVFSSQVAAFYQICLLTYVKTMPR